MKLRSPGAAALREAARRRPAPLSTSGPALDKAAATLRSIFYPKQRHLFGRDPDRRKRATKKTRRAGATVGGVREFLARAIEQPGFRASYVTDTAKNARKRAWENDTQSGFVDVLRRVAQRVKHRSLEALKIGPVTIEVRDGDLLLDFSNGSQIELFGADSITDHAKMRGIAKHIIWIDEAQDFPFLEQFYTAVVVGSLTDYRGDIWLTGTPGKDCAGMFYEITKEEEGDRLEGWDVHVIAATDNPLFGAVSEDFDGCWVTDNTGTKYGPYGSQGEAEIAAVDIRWQNTAELAKKENHWTGDEPDYQREQLGRWVRGDARYVYPVYSVPEHILLFAPQRLADNPFVGSHSRFSGHPPWYDHQAALRDLPRFGPNRRPHKWLFSLALDDGYFPDPFALVLWAFTPTLPDVYEMFSWKMTKVDADDKAAYVKLIYEPITEIVSFVGDPAGMKGDFAVWRRRLNLPIEEAEKAGKNQLEELLANDVRATRVHLRKGSPLHTEMRHLVYLPGQPGKPRMVDKHRKVAGVVHGDHCCDAARYGYSDLTHYLAKIEAERPKPGTPEVYAEEGRRAEQFIDEHERRMEQLDEADERARESDELVREYMEQM